MHNILTTILRPSLRLGADARVVDPQVVREWLLGILFREALAFAFLEQLLPFFGVGLDFLDFLDFRAELAADDFVESSLLTEDSAFVGLFEIRGEVGLLLD